MICDRDDQPVAIDRMQHRRRRSIQISILEVGASLIGNLCVHRHRTQELTLSIVFDKGTGGAVNHLAGGRNKADVFVFQLAASAQGRTQLFDDAFGRLLGYKLLGFAADHLVPFITEPGEHCIVDIKIGAILGNRGRHNRRLAEQPFIVFWSDHSRTIYEIS